MPDTTWKHTRAITICTEVANLCTAADSLGVKEGTEVFFCWKTNADIRATASSGSRSSNWFSNKHSVHISSSPEFISQATRPLIWTTRSSSIHPISLRTSIYGHKNNKNLISKWLNRNKSKHYTDKHPYPPLKIRHLLKCFIRHLILQIIDFLSVLEYLLN